MAPILHEPGLGVGEVALGLRSRGRLGRVRDLGRPPFRFPVGLARPPLPLGPLGPRGVRCLDGLRFRLRLQRGLGLTDLGEPILAAGQLGGQLVAAPALPMLGVLRRIDCGGLREERRDLLLQFLLGLAHPAVAHRLVLGGIRQDLGPVQRHVPQAHQPGPLAELEHLAEQAGEGRQVALPKGGNAIVIGVLVGRQDPVGDLLVGGPLDLARGGFPHAVGIDQQLHQQRRVVRRLPAPVAGLIDGDDRRQTQRVDHVADEQRQMAFGEPVPQRGGQQEQLVGVVRFEGFHADTIAQPQGVSSPYCAC